MQLYKNGFTIGDLLILGLIISISIFTISKFKKLNTNDSSNINYDSKIENISIAFLN